MESGRRPCAAGVVIGAGQIFGGGVAVSFAGAIAQNFGIQYTLYFALGRLLAGAAVSMFLKEAVPRFRDQGPI